MTEKKRILVVEDDLASSEVLKFALESKGHEVIQATNGKDALTLARERQPELVILDIMMPKMDGYHFSRLLKFDIRFNKVPVIMVTSKIQEADRELGLACGSNEYITKPYDINKLMETVEKYLGSTN